MTTSAEACCLEKHYARLRGKTPITPERMLRLLAPWEGILSVPSLVVTGTNGKGTVCAYFESIMRALGKQTGLYTSPHLVTPRERIRIAGLPVVEPVLRSALRDVELQMDQALPDATFFEVTTATALLVFLRAQVDVAVLEVGIGGRNDSVNVMRPLVSALTTVGLDHVQQLGNSEGKIATEKAYVSRAGHPLVVGSLSGEAMAAVREVVVHTGATLVSATSPLPQGLASLFEEMVQTRPELRSNENSLRVALHCVAAWAEETGERFELARIREGLLNCFWPGRFDVRRLASGCELVLDAAHNPAGFAFFADCWRERFGDQKVPLVYGSMGDKDWRTVIPLLGRVASHVSFVEMNHPRSAKAAELHRVGVECGLSCACVGDPIEAIRSETRGSSRCIALGSIGLVGEIMTRLRIDPFAPEDVVTLLQPA